jgi:hypothetical protein
MDVFLSFSIVAYIIGLGYIVNLNSIELYIWNIAVVLNVLGAGYGRFMSSVRNLKSA